MLTKWSLEYFDSTVEAALLNLPDGLLSRYFRLAELMMEFGSNLGMPHTRPIGNGVFELRIKGNEGIARALFCTKMGKRIIVLYVFVKKTQKTPKKIIELANKRMSEVMNNDP
jgi:phage-related protein